MSPRVSLSLKAARSLLEACLLSPAADELSAAIAKAQRSSATRRKLRQPKESKRSAKLEETSTIRAEVVERAKGGCEACSGPTGPAGELDHFYGRAKAHQTVFNTWLLCRRCHLQKTDNKPDAASWVRLFIAHCLIHRYFIEARRAEQKLAWVESKAVPR